MAENSTKGPLDSDVLRIEGHEPGGVDQDNICIPAEDGRTLSQWLSPVAFCVKITQ